MNDQDFQNKLGELLEKIDELPAERRGELHKLVEETKSRHANIKESIQSLQNSLDHLRLSVKYLVFDLEATRRENEYLRRLINQEGDEAGE